METVQKENDDFNKDINKDIYIIMIDKFPHGYVTSQEEAEKQILIYADNIKNSNFLEGYNCIIEEKSPGTLHVLGKFRNFLISYMSLLHEITFVPVKYFPPLSVF